MRPIARVRVVGVALQCVLTACSSNDTSSHTTGSTGTSGLTTTGAGGGGSSSTGIGAASSSGSNGSGASTGGLSATSSDSAVPSSSLSSTTAIDDASSDGGTPSSDATASTDTGGTPDSGTLASDGAPTDAGVGWDTVPAILARIVPPTFNNLDCDVTKYGGVGDGTTDNTSAFAQAIAACSKAGGGRVVVPAGTFFTGPIVLVSNINLYVSAGATIKFTTDPAKYLPAVKVSWEGSLMYNYQPLIYANGATNVAITGPGTIDGNASNSDWYTWKAKGATDQANLRTQNANNVPVASRIYGAGHYLRPGLIEFYNCTNILFDGFTAQNSPFWTIHPVFSHNITARGFHSVGNVQNTDGFDPESCTDVLIENATIDVGDDAIAIKAGRDHDGWTYYTPTENVVIQGCTVNSHVGGVAIGSEMSAGVRNVYVQNMKFGMSSRALFYGFYVKSAITRGGFIRDVYAKTISVGTVDTFFYLTGHYVSGPVIGPTSFTTVSNINVDGATVAKTNNQPFFIAGSDATKVATGIHLSNITVTASATPALASGSGHYSGLTTTNDVVNGAAFNPPSSAP